MLMERVGVLLALLACVLLVFPGCTGSRAFFDLNEDGSTQWYEGVGGVAFYALVGVCLLAWAAFVDEYAESWDDDCRVLDPDRLKERVYETVARMV
ncbi:MAG: hypothetical protein ACYTDX_08070 [Planctomycetota bacterium]|jgi:hypothetical protein